MSAPGMERWAAASEPYGKGRRAGVGALLDEELLGLLRRYKRQVAKRYRVVEPDIIRRALPDEELFVSPKLDGELWFLAARGGDVALVTFNGRVLHDIGCLEGVAARLAGADVVIAGELVAAPAGERPRNHHVGKALSDGKLEGALSFHAFDLVTDGGADALAWPYEQRHARLVELLGEDAGARTTVVHTQRGDASFVSDRYREWVLSDRFEGVVARSDRGLTYKIKPTSTIDMVVLAFGERITGDITQVRELQVGLMREDDTFQLVGSVGTGLSEEDRVAWHKRLTQMEVKSAFRLANREGTLCRFVRPEIVVEIRISDMLATDSWDAPIRRMSLAYDEAEGYRAIGETRTAVLLHPVLVREREDKVVDVGHVGFTQIVPWLEETTQDEPANVRHAAAEVLRRGVFTKETKGKVAVRKYVVIRTHKESEGTHPPFVVYFTDFSSGRKEPLSTSLRTAASPAGVDEHVRAWILDNVKRGWSEADSGRIGEAPPLPEPAPVADKAPKPKRARKPKAAAEPSADADGSADSDASEEPAPKKKRAPRKKKAPAAE